MRRLDLSGQRFGQLKVLKEAECRNGRGQWVCQCDCGEVRTIDAQNLKLGRTKSCAHPKCKFENFTGFRLSCKGYRTHPLYSRYYLMRKRCEDPKNQNYKHYGGRGITVCERWKAIANFIADMGLPPEGHSLDRIDVDGNYEPSNCRWADAVTQANNKRPRTKNAPRAVNA